MKMGFWDFERASTNHYDIATYQSYQHYFCNEQTVLHYLKLIIKHLTGAYMRHRTQKI